MAEQTLTINTLAATVITPSDVSQFSLDDIAPNIINGGGGTIVDVSGIVTLASQVAELDSDVTVLEANVATVQADVTALQEDVSGLDAAVAQAQTTATAAAETATAASGTATQATSIANEAKSAATRAQLAANDAMGVANTANAAAMAASKTAQYALTAGEAQSAVSATSLNYTTTEGRSGYTLQAIANTSNRSWFARIGDDDLAASAAITLVAPQRSGYGSAGFFVSDNYSYEGTRYTAMTPLASTSFTKHLVEATAAYALAVAGDSSGGGFDGSYAGSEVLLSASGSTLVLSADSADLAAADRKPLNLSGYEIRLNGHIKTSLGPDAFYIGGTSLRDVIISAAGGVHASNLRYYSDPDNASEGSAKLIIDSSAKTFLFYTGDGGDILAATAGSGDSSSSGYPPLTQRSNLYYGIVDDNSSLRFGSFGAADGSQEEAVVKVFYDDIYVTSCGGYSSNSGLTYGLAVVPPVLRFGTWGPDTNDGANMYQGMYIPNGNAADGHMAVGSFAGNDSTRVWGLMANSTTAAFGNVTHSPSGVSVAAITGIQVSNRYVLLTTHLGYSAEKSSLEMTSTGTTLSAMFTLNNGGTSIAPTDWAKLKQLADNADALIALLSN